jgi:3-isopropylmalate/(R)-2-methylmalate dehydratase small subunit
MSNRPFTTHTGIAAPLFRDNIDTDQIIPSREMKSLSKTGLADGMFAGQRYLEGRTPNPDFILNKPDYAGSTILLSGKNFGCGSSREHAVWALKEFGIRAVIAESFGEIFYNNCVANGLLPIAMDTKAVRELPKSITIDLPVQTVSGMKFDIAAGDKKTLVGGLDAIALTQEHEADIAGFFKRDEQARPWIYS